MYEGRKLIYFDKTNCMSIKITKQSARKIEINVETEYEMLLNKEL